MSSRRRWNIARRSRNNRSATGTRTPGIELAVKADHARSESWALVGGTVPSSADHSHEQASEECNCCTLIAEFVHIGLLYAGRGKSQPGENARSARQRRWRLWKSRTLARRTPFARSTRSTDLSPFTVAATPPARNPFCAQGLRSSVRDVKRTLSLFGILIAFAFYCPAENMVLPSSST